MTRVIAEPCRQEKFESWSQSLEVSGTGCAKLHDGPLLVFFSEAILACQMRAHAEEITVQHYKPTPKAG